MVVNSFWNKGQLLINLHISSVQLLSCVWLFLTPWTAAHQASLSITNSQSLFKLMSIKSIIPSNHLIICCPLLLLLSIFPSIRVFSNESVLQIRWPKYWSFSISPSNENSGLISFRMDWLDLLAVWGHHYLHYLHHSLTSGQITGREHSPALQQKIGLKIYWAWPIRARPNLPLSQSLPSASFHKPLILLH